VLRSWTTFLARILCSPEYKAPHWRRARLPQDQLRVGIAAASNYVEPIEALMKDSEQQWRRGTARRNHAHMHGGADRRCVDLLAGVRACQMTPRPRARRQVMMRQAALTMEMTMAEPTDEDNELEAAILALKTRRDLDAIKPKFRTEVLIEIGSMLAARRGIEPSYPSNPETAATPDEAVEFINGLNEHRRRALYRMARDNVDAKKGSG
jgi:hypothetical protein